MSANPYAPQRPAAVLARIRLQGFDTTTTGGPFHAGRDAYANGFRVIDALAIRIDQLDQTEAAAQVREWLAGFFIAHEEAQAEI